MRWPVVSLGEVASLERRSLAPEQIESGTNYLGLEHIESGGRIIEYRSVESGELKSNKFLFDPKTLLYGKLRPYLAKVCIPDREGCCSTDIIPIRPGELLNIDYLKHLLLWRPYIDKASSLTSGANLPRISPKALLGIAIPLPLLEEQLRIAAILDKSTYLQKVAKNQLRTARSLLQSIFIETIGDPLSNPHAWPKRLLADVVKSGTDVTYGIVQAGEEFPGGIPYIRTGDLVDGEIDCSSLRHTNPEIANKFRRSRVEAGDIVMSIRATVGTTAVVPESLDGANLTQGTARIAPSDLVCGEYLLQYLRMPSTQFWIQRQVKGATFREITLKRLRELPVMIPTKEAQQRFAQRAQIAYSRISMASNFLERTMTLASSLSTELLSQSREYPLANAGDSN